MADRLNANIEVLKQVVDQLIRLEHVPAGSVVPPIRVGAKDPEMDEVTNAPQLQVMRVLMEGMLQPNVRKRADDVERHAFRVTPKMFEARHIDPALAAAALSGLQDEKMIETRRGVDEHDQNRPYDYYVPVVDYTDSGKLDLREFVDFYKRIGGIGYSGGNDFGGKEITLYLNPQKSFQAGVVLSTLARKLGGDLSFEYMHETGAMVCQTTGFHDNLFDSIGGNSGMRQSLMELRDYLNTPEAKATLADEPKATRFDLAGVFDHGFTDRVDSAPAWAARR